MINVCKNLKNVWILACHFGMFYVQLPGIATVGIERLRAFCIGNHMGFLVQFGINLHK